MPYPSAWEDTTSLSRQTIGELLRRSVASLDIVEWGILGSDKKADAAPFPDGNTLVVDPAGLYYVQNGVAGAGGVSGDIYDHIFDTRDAQTRLPLHVTCQLHSIGTSCGHEYSVKDAPLIS